MGSSSGILCPGSGTGAVARVPGRTRPASQRPVRLRPQRLPGKDLLPALATSAEDPPAGPAPEPHRPPLLWPGGGDRRGCQGSAGGTPRGCPVSQGRAAGTDREEGEAGGMPSTPIENFFPWPQAEGRQCPAPGRAPRQRSGAGPGRRGKGRRAGSSACAAHPRALPPRHRRSPFLAAAGPVTVTSPRQQPMGGRGDCVAGGAAARPERGPFGPAAP